MIKKITTKDKLVNALKAELKKVKEGKINSTEQSFQIIRVELIEPKIVNSEENDIDENDFINASEISFDNATIIIGIPNGNGSTEISHYCNGSAKIKYDNNDFAVRLSVSRIWLK